MHAYVSTALAGPRAPTCTTANCKHAATKQHCAGGVYEHKLLAVTFMPEVPEDCMHSGQEVLEG